MAVSVPVAHPPPAMLAPGKTQRLGVFGGAFDPPHLAHAALAQAAMAQLQLGELRVVPTGHAWHKPRPLTAAPHRLAMAQLAFGGQPGVVVDEREIRRAGPTYTLDTLRELQAEQPTAQLYLVLGADQAAALHTWHQAHDIVRIAIIYVAARAGKSLATGQFDSQFATQAAFSGSSGLGSIELQLPLMPISATAVRLHAAQGLALTHLVAPAVARYIQDHHLYQGVE
ncbi:MAG: nicotinate (nicotinamide) nucleotide adenylyltransferase [Burkholderiaceae bacterium]